MIRSRLTYANVTATLALVFALGGGAYAVQGIPDQAGVFHGCVRKSNGTLRVVRAGTPCKKKGKTAEFAIKWNQHGRNGLNGKDGQPGLDGTNGKDGKNGATSVVVRTGSFSTDANCQGDERAVGGGGVPDTGATLKISRPNPTSGTPTGWHAEEAGGTFELTTYVVCASP